MKCEYKYTNKAEDLLAFWAATLIVGFLVFSVWLYSFNLMFNFSNTIKQTGIFALLFSPIILGVWKGEWALERFICFLGLIIYLFERTFKK